MTRRTASGLILSASVGRLAAATVPRPLPDISITLPGGGAVKLSQYRGKVLAFSFILTT